MRTSQPPVRGFTLIELLVVISIIATLSFIGLVTYSNAQISARDQKRKQDLALIQQGLELYYQQNKSYPLVNPVPSPNTDPDYGITNTWNYDQQTPLDPTGWIHGMIPGYMTLMPSDPKPSEHIGCYFYSYEYKTQTITTSPGCTAGQWYALEVDLENANDPEALANKDVKWCNGVSVRANSGCPTHLYIVVTK